MQLHWAGSLMCNVEVVESFEVRKNIIFCGYYEFTVCVQIFFYKRQGSNLEKNLWTTESTSPE